MNEVVLLDAGPLGMIAHPKPNPAVDQWLQRLLTAGIRIYVSEIADYEVRRELIRSRLIKSLGRLDQLKHRLGYMALTTADMLQVAGFWAVLRNQGSPTAPDPALDCDVILAAQATRLALRGSPVIVATENMNHLARLVTARSWTDAAWPQ
jgi:hypothetical protein